MPLQQASLWSQGRPAGLDNQQCLWHRVRACRGAGLSLVRRCRLCAIGLRIPPLRGRVPQHWFLQGSAKKGVERKDRLHEAQHRPCRVGTGGTENGGVGQHRLQEGAVTSPCVFGVPLMPLSWLSQSADVSPRGRLKVNPCLCTVSSGQHAVSGRKDLAAQGADLMTYSFDPSNQDNRLATSRSLASR